VRVPFVAGLLLACACGGAEAHEGAADPLPRAGIHHPHGRHVHDFSRVDEFVPLFEGPERDAWQRPADVVELLQIAPGATVVDLGAGTGYFLPHLARAGEGVHVLGLDVEPAMVEHMRERIRTEELANVEARVCVTDDPGLSDASVDRVLVVNTWHHIADRASYAARLHRALRPGGFVLVVDFTPEAAHGPPPEMRLTPEAVIAELAAGGLDAVEVVDESLPDQYVVRAAR
jgi:ubiquinone/menaquinone biosynthesis C-methylase UbiE